MPQRKGCAARRYSDEMNCTACGLHWDVNDPNPPACRPEPAPRLRELPDELPPHIAVRMHARFIQSREAGRCNVAGMRAAYGVLKEYLK